MVTMRKMFIFRYFNILDKVANSGSHDIVVGKTKSMVIFKKPADTDLQSVPLN